MFTFLWMVTAYIVLYIIMVMGYYDWKWYIDFFNGWPEWSKEDRFLTLFLFLVYNFLAVATLSISKDSFK